MNPSTAFGMVLVDELMRCGLAEAVIAPGSRSAPLAMALHERTGHERAGDERASAGLRLHVRIDERSAAYLALGLAKASGVPPVVVCTSGTAAANFHPAVVEADEACVPLIVLTADRPPELRGTGANQAIDQIKLYGSAVRWFSEAGVPQDRPGMVAYWRSLACHAWAHATGGQGGPPGPVHLNLPLAEPLVPDGDPAWSEPLDGRAGGAPWTRTQGAPQAPAHGTAPAQSPFPDPAAGPPPAPSAGSPPALAGPSPAPAAGAATDHSAPTAGAARSRASARPGQDGNSALGLPGTERGVLMCADGAYDPGPLLAHAEAHGWPVLAEPSSGARRGPNALSAYPYLLAVPGFVARHQPEVVVTAGKPGLSRQQLGFLRESTAAGARHIVVADRTGRWADPARTASSVVAVPPVPPADPADNDDGGASGYGASGHGASGHGGGEPGASAVTGWLMSWLTADAAARAAADEVLDEEPAAVSEPRLARDLSAALPDGSLLWAASSLPIRDLDMHMPVRTGLRVLASRGASGIDGLVSAALGAALAHQRSGGGPAAALLGDLALLHDLAGLVLGPGEPRPDAAIVVANNDGGGIFSLLEQAAFPASFERVFGTPHGVDLGSAAGAVRLPYIRLERPADLRPVLQACAPRGSGLHLIEARTSREAGTGLRSRVREAASAAVQEVLTRPVR